jgi:hypothetical protein
MNTNNEIRHGRHGGQSRGCRRSNQQHLQRGLGSTQYQAGDYYDDGSHHDDDRGSGARSAQRNQRNRA